MSDGYKKYDSDDEYKNWYARLTKDAEVRDADGKKLVRLTVVSTSKAESDDELWVEITPVDNQMDIASFLKKGDIFGVEGKPTKRSYGEPCATCKVRKSSFNVRRAKLHLSIDLLVKLKERGFVPGQGGDRAQAPAGKAKPGKAKEVLNLDDE